MIKGSSTIAKQSIQVVVSQVKVPTSTPSTQPTTLPVAGPTSRLASPLQALEQEEYGTDASASSFSYIQNPKTPQMLENRRHTITSLLENWFTRLGSFCLSLTQQQRRTKSWAHHWDGTPFFFNRKSWIDLHLSSYLLWLIYLIYRWCRTTQKNPARQTLLR